MASTRDEMIATATTYLDALVTHDGRAVPLAPNCWRTELGRNSGMGADDIRTRLAWEGMSGISGYRDVRWFVDGNDAIALYILDATGNTVHLVERFRVIGGLIHEIEAIFHISQVANQRRWPDDPAEVWTVENSGGRMPR